MTFLALEIAIAASFMTQSGNSITLEPGKQLPQSLTIRVDTDGKPRDVTLPYLLFAPKDYSKVGQKWPLMLFLHGLGESGIDELERVKAHGPPGFVDSRPDFPFVVVSPQLAPPPGEMKDVPLAWQPEPLIRLVDHVMKNTNIDESRVYVTGLSMGGFGTWRLVSAYPERFAAAVPICGGGKPATMAPSLRRVPIWAFHGARDQVVPLCKSQEMVHAVRCAGGDVRLTVYPDVEHDSWTATYTNPKVYDWLLSHRGPIK